MSHSTSYHKSNEAEQREGYPPYQIDPHDVLSNGRQSWPDEFVLRCDQLLKTFVARIRRCPHCTKVFLQVRCNARYCGRTCHAAAGMERLRKKQRAEKALKLKRNTQRKGRAPHGKKTRTRPRHHTAKGS